MVFARPLSPQFFIARRSGTESLQPSQRQTVRVSPCLSLTLSLSLACKTSSKFGDRSINGTRCGGELITYNRSRTSHAMASTSIASARREKERERGGRSKGGREAGGEGEGVIDLPVGVGDGIYRIAGIILQKESRRGQTLSWWREGSGKRGCEGSAGERSGQAGWLAGRQAGSVVALVLIHSPCRPPSRRPTEVEKERERESARGRRRGRE